MKEWIIARGANKMTGQVVFEESYEVTELSEQEREEMRAHLATQLKMRGLRPTILDQ